MNAIGRTMFLLCVLAASLWANGDGPPLPDVVPMAADIYQWNKGMLTWDWLPAITGAPITEYVLTCRQGATIVVKRFPGTVLETPMSGLGTPGDWACTIKALRGATEVATSNDFPFGLVSDLRLRGVSR